MGALVIYQLGKQLNLPLQAVPYRGGSPLLSDLLGNQIPASGSILPDYLEYHRAGKLKSWRTRARNALGAGARHSDDHRSRLSRLCGRHVLRPVCPGRLSLAIASEYSSIVTEALGTAPVVEALHKMGLVPVGGTPAEFLQKVLADRTRWAPVIKESGIRMDT